MLLITGILPSVNQLKGNVCKSIIRYHAILHNQSSTVHPPNQKKTCDSTLPQGCRFVPESKPNPGVTNIYISIPSVAACFQKMLLGTSFATLFHPKKTVLQDLQRVFGMLGGRFFLLTSCTIPGQVQLTLGR